MPALDWTASQLTAEIQNRLNNGSDRFVAQAPGRLDVIGGLAEYTGSLVLNMTIGDQVCVGAQARTDGTVSVTRLQPAETGQPPPSVIDVRELHLSGDDPVRTAQICKLAGVDIGDAVSCVLGTLAEAQREGLVPDWGGGLSIVVGSTLDSYCDVGREAAVAAATLVATARVRGVELDASQALTVCRRVVTDWLRSPSGAADSACALLGEPHSLTQMRCEAATIASPIRLPDDVTIAGIDCGVPHPESKIKCERVRTAAFMGRLLIDRIVKHEGGDGMGWDGQLSRVSMTDYVGRFRDRLPTKMKGREFLSRFGETGDPRTHIDPDFVYKIRSRTEHHIYENARAAQFAECLSRAIRTGNQRVLAEAGELMYASHWSYGQRCGLGGVKTDLLVNLIRRHGIDADIYGAKISGSGSGAVVTVVMGATEQASAALDAAVDAYHAKLGESARFIRGSSPGALVAGAKQT